MQGQAVLSSPGSANHTHTRWEWEKAGRGLSPGGSWGTNSPHSPAERVHLPLQVYRLPCQGVPLPCELLQPLSQGFPLFLPLEMLLLPGAHSFLAA